MRKDIDTWDPMNWMRRMRREMPNFFEETGVQDKRYPLTDILDREEKILIKAELPGVKKADIDLDVDEETVSIRAETQMEYEKSDEEQGSYFQERTYSSFGREIPLPVKILPEETKASFKNGLLVIELTKKDYSGPDSRHKINIEWNFLIQKNNSEF